MTDPKPTTQELEKESGHADVKRFKDEALTGITTVVSSKSGFTVSRQSDIDSAALHGTKDHHQSRTPESIMAEIDRDIKARDKLCGMLRITLLEYDQLMAEGRIRPCKRCGEIGIFNFKGAAGSTSSRYQSSCRKCQKSDRENKNV
jgi:hypothetical protein